MTAACICLYLSHMYIANPSCIFVIVCKKRERERERREERERTRETEREMRVEKERERERERERMREREFLKCIWGAKLQRQGFLFKSLWAAVTNESAASRIYSTLIKLAFVPAAEYQLIRPALSSPTSNTHTHTSSQLISTQQRVAQPGSPARFLPPLLAHSCHPPSMT